MTILKKISMLCCAILLLVPVSTSAAPYTGNGPGTSTIGMGADYSSLFDATMAVNTHTLTGGDWTFLILNNLTETNNSVFGAPELSSHTITFRPAPGTQPTVTFITSTAPLYDSRGHIAVGFSTATLNTFTPRPIHNVTFDGSNTPGGTTCDLLFTNINTPSGCTGIFDVRGDCDNIHIRNCRLSAYAPTLTLSPITGSKVVAFNGLSISGEYKVPDLSSVENCDLETTRLFYGIISCAHYPTPPAGKSTGIRIANNRIRGDMLSGILLGAVTDCEVTSNTIETSTSAIHLPQLIPIATSIFYLGSNTPNNDSSPEDPRTIKISANKIRFADATNTQSGLAGIDINGGTTYANIEISNNTVTGIQPDMIGTYSSFKRCGISFNIDPPSYQSGWINCTMINNSVALTTTSVTRQTISNVATGIHINYTPGHFTVSNNIIRNDIANSSCLSILGTGGVLVSDSNNFAPSEGANVASLKTASGAVTLKQLTNWQAYSGQDANSISQDPFIEAELDAGVWVGPPNTLHPDMHFTGHPGAAYRVPRHPDVLTDLDGTPRPANDTIMGAYQPPPPTSSIGRWMLY